MRRSAMRRDDQWFARVKVVVAPSPSATRSCQSPTVILASGTAARTIASLPSGMAMSGSCAALSRLRVAMSRWS